MAGEAEVGAQFGLLSPPRREAVAFLLSLVREKAAERTAERTELRESLSFPPVLAELRRVLREKAVP